MLKTLHYYCAVCGTGADRYFTSDTCACCQSNTWIEEEVQCCCLVIVSSLLFQEDICITHEQCPVHS